MSSWTFENYKAPHKTYPNLSIHASYCWNKGAPYSVYVGVFNEKGIEQWCIFENTYASVESAKRAFKRQVRKIKNGDY